MDEPYGLGPFNGRGAWERKFKLGLADLQPERSFFSLS